MKITFDHTTQIEKNSSRVERGKKAEVVGKTYSAHVNVAFDGKERVGFGTEPISKSKNGTPEITDSAEMQVQNMRNQMTVLSHTMSDEDFAQMQKEGFDPAEMEPQEAVTILDKIKAELLKAGEHVAGFTDNVDLITLAEAVGSEVLAEKLATEFAQQDIPADKQNVEQVLGALDIAKRMKEPTESTYYFMAANGMEATLKDFYLAASSGSSLEQQQNTSYFAEEVGGYVTRNIDGTSTEDFNLQQEITRLLEKLQIQTGEEEMQVAGWLVEKGLAVDADTMSRMKDVFAVEFPLNRDCVIEASVAAIAQGKPAVEGNLADRTTYWEKAFSLLHNYEGEDALKLVQDRRRLEEVRLYMTTETNIKLIKSGFSIETAAMEDTLEALKQAEEQLAAQYFPEEKQPEIKYQLYKETTHLLKEIPQLPLATVSRWAERLETGVLSEFHAEGRQLAAEYEKAGERYETLWTAPRADLGDSLKKAFANVDELLKELHYETTEENRKAVRALGYNRMSITEENVEKVKTALNSVDKLVQRMTPAATLRMIRDGVNPLDSTFAQLQQYFDELGDEFHQTAEKYSKFLYQLEKQGEITSQEREAFIGCYRLLNQLEKSDGAAVGALVNVGGELNFTNLLTAIRSNKLKNVDVKIHDMVGALTEEAVMKFSISEQIQQAYEKERAKECREQYKEAADASAESFQILQRGELSATTGNILAAKVLEQEPCFLWEALIGKKVKNEKEGASGRIQELWNKLDNKKQFSEEFVKDIQECVEQSEQQMWQDADTSIDVRSRKLLHKQLHIMQSLAPKEEYYFPMEIGGEVTGIHLQFTHNEMEQGLIRLTMEGAGMGCLSGYLQVTEKGIEGYFVGNNQQTIMNLKTSSDIISNNIRKEWNFCEIEYFYNETNHIPMDWTRRSAGVQVSNDRLYSLTKDFLQAVKAVGDGMEER